MVSYLNFCKSLGEEQVTHLAQNAKDWALTHGIVMRTKQCPSSSEVAEYVPLALFPMVTPKTMFDKAVNLQTHFNLLMHKIAHSHEFLEESLKNTIKVDDFTNRLWRIYEATRKAPNRCQSICVGLFRSDYMLHCDGDQSNGSDLKEAIKMVELKQIEINTISASFSGLASRMVEFHRYILNMAGIQYQDEQVPLNEASAGLAKGLIQAWDLYNNPNAVILFLVTDKERNHFDQKWLDYGIYSINPNVKVIRSTFQDVGRTGCVDSKNKLFVDDLEVAVVYFRAGYIPSHYESEKDWDTRLLMECSQALKCPSINYQLVGAKKIQQELTRPGSVEKFVTCPDLAKQIRSTFAGQYSLDLVKEGNAAVEIALKNPKQFVLKPQREGGGNNLFGESIRKYLQEFRESPKRAGYILMERLYPLAQKNILLRPGDSFNKIDVISEIGVFGVIIGTAEKVHENKQVGHLVRSKSLGTDEGGIAAGFAAMDSPFLC